MNAHFPTIHCYTLLKRKCEIELEQHRFREAGITLLQSQAITFHHQALQQYSKRTMKFNEKNSKNKFKIQEPILTDDEEDMFKDESSDEENHSPTWSKKGESLEQMLSRILSFQSSEETTKKFSSLLKKLPSEWRIVQINAAFPTNRSNPFKSFGKDEVNRDENLALSIVSIDCSKKGTDEDITIHKVPAMPKREQPTILKEFQDILSMHKRIYNVDENFSRKEHNSNRDDVDNRLVSIIDTIENKWLGFAKCLLFGRPIKQELIEKVESTVSALYDKFFQSDKLFVSSGRKLLLSRCLEAMDSLSQSQLNRCLLYCLKGEEEKLPELIEETKNKMGTKDEDMFSRRGSEIRHPVILILDRDVQCLPWESMSCLQDMKSPQSMTRVPSLSLLFALMAAQQINEKSIGKTGIRDSNIFYVLNPDKNLGKTQKRLEGPFQDMNLGPGVIGEQPSLPQMHKVLSEMDAFIYCGHGSTMASLPQNEIEKMNIRAVPLLFGCNSGRLSKMARNLDPLGTVSSYLIASAPCLLGFLWSVTDRDIDIWTVGFLNHWLGKSIGPHEENFSQAVANRRRKFSRIINSAATVIYGLPSVTR